MLSRNAAQLTPAHAATLTTNTATGGGITTHSARSSPSHTKRTLNPVSSLSRYGSAENSVGSRARSN